MRFFMIFIATSAFMGCHKEEVIMASPPPETYATPTPANIALTVLKSETGFRFDS